MHDKPRVWSGVGIVAEMSPAELLPDMPAFVFVASLVTIMASVSKSTALGLTGSLGGTVADTIVSLMYLVVLAELILRPLKHRLDLLEQ